MRLVAEPLRQCLDKSRLADARLARNQYDLAVTCLDSSPAAEQQVDLLIAPD